MSEDLQQQKPKHPGGRPRAEFKPEYCDMVIKHMERGFSFESFAGVLSISKDLLYNFVERHPEFADAKRTAFERSRLFWENLAIENAVEHTIPGEGSRKLNSTAWIFNMKNRFGWTDRQEVRSDNVNVNLEAQIDLSGLTDDELNTIEILLAKAKGDNAG